MKTIFFDFGNVIGFFDHQRAVQKFTRYSDTPAAQLTQLLYGSELELAYERGDLSTAEYIQQAMSDGKIACTSEQFLAAFLDIFWPNPAVCDLIPKLKPRYRVGLASNTNDAHYTRYTAQFADVLKYFDALCPSHQARARKPHDAYFEYCQRFAEADPSECVFVDDLPENIEAARQHGWKGILYRPDTDLIAELARVGVVLG